MTRMFCILGVAIVQGVKSGKILGMKARNRYCSMCQQQRPHDVCYRNHCGSAGSMEPSIMVELFEEATRSDLRYTSFVGDGDSAVEKALKTEVSYGSYIHKIECKNHKLKVRFIEKENKRTLAVKNYLTF